MDNPDIRGQQRFANFSKVFAKLDDAVKVIRTKYADEQGNIADSF